MSSENAQLTTRNSAAILGALRWGAINRAVRHIWAIPDRADNGQYPQAHSMCGYERDVAAVGTPVLDGSRPCQNCLRVWRTNGEPEVYGAYTASFLPGEPGYTAPEGGESNAEGEAEQGHEGRQAPVREQAQVAMPGP